MFYVHLILALWMARLTIAEFFRAPERSSRFRLFFNAILCGANAYYAWLRF